jgi:hypothetical protein
LVYRAIRPDVWPRVVAVRASAVVFETGEPDGDGVFAIERFEVPQAEHDAFVADWAEARSALAAQRGYLGARVHRDGDEFVALTRWSSPLMVHRARALLPPDPALYQRSE